MDASLSQYSNQFRVMESSLAGSQHQWVKKLRQDAFDRFIQTGFPTTKVEEWKYTSLHAFAQRCFDGRATPSIISKTDLNYPALNDQNSYCLTFHNGRLIPSLSVITSLPQGLTVQPIANILESDPRALEKVLQEAQGQGGFRELNTALMTDGAYIHISAGAQINTPIHLLFVGSGDAAAAHIRNIVIAEAGSAATIIESYIGLDDSEYFTNTISDVSVGANASIEHYKLKFESEKAFHIATIQVTQDRDSRYTSHNIVNGGGLVRNDLHVNLAAINSECVLNGLYMAHGRQHIDNHTSINHQQPHCSSREWYKGILDGNARGVFSGRIVVHPQAQRTDAQQTNNNLLLSEGAEVDSKPQLEIYADDVKCSHGTTVGQIDANALFYLRSRALDEDLSRRILVDAFANDILDSMRLIEIKRYIQDRLSRRYLRGHVSRELL